MKKLNKKQRQAIKAGRLSGALFNGIGNIIKSVGNVVTGIIDSVCGWVMGFQEAGKGHAKMNLKVGNAAISYDDTSKIHAAERLTSEQIKGSKTTSTNPKKVVLSHEEHIVDLDNGHHSDNDLSHMMDDNMHAIDNFIHF